MTLPFAQFVRKSVFCFITLIAVITFSGCGQPIGNWQDRKPVGADKGDPSGSKTGQSDQNQKNGKTGGGSGGNGTGGSGGGSGGSGSAGPFGCKAVFQDSLVAANLNWLTGPALNEENFFELSFTATANGAAVTEFEPHVYLWMPAHGHGSAPIRLTETNADEGQWRASNVHFIMPGFWELRIQLKKDGKVCDEFRQRIDL